MKTQLLTLTTLICFLLSSQSWAELFPNGNYQGHGFFKTKTETGSYLIHTSIKDNLIKSNYSLPDGSKKEWNFQMSTQANGFFKVQTNGIEVGQGYCLEKAVVCHYEIKVNNLSLEETFTLLSGRLYRFGSKDDGTGQIMWQEAADKEE
jgi:hypothetical protein